MKIESSLVAMRSQHTRMEITAEQESLRMRRREAAPPTPPPRAENTMPADISAEDALAVDSGEEDLMPLDEMKLGILKLLLEKLTGLKIKVFSSRELKARFQEIQDQAGQAPQQPPKRADSQAQGGGDFALAYDYNFSHIETENTQVQMQALVQTSDGKTINVGVQLNLSRQLVQHQEIHLRAGDQKLLDPLVVNFNGSSAELTQRQFQFDLNADGQTDQIAFLKPGSGFLALDKNRDGVINDGRELFGALGGNGFDELARYDTDGNHFIDEADAIFQQLKIWTKDADGKDRLMAIGQAGIGAIYLGHVSSEFSLVDGQRQQVGQLRETGFFLREDGSAGTVQKIDLVV